MQESHHFPNFRLMKHFDKFKEGHSFGSSADGMSPPKPDHSGPITLDCNLLGTDPGRRTRAALVTVERNQHLTGYRLDELDPAVLP